MSSYEYLRSIDMTVDNVLQKLPQLLENDGFTIISNIDVSLLLKERLNIDYRRYHILGVANPPQILKALDAEQSIGLLFPSNIVVYQKPGGGTIVGTIRPVTVLKLAENDNLREVAKFLETKLKLIIDEI